MTNGDSTGQEPRLRSDARTKVTDNSRLHIARWSLGLFITGLVGPIFVFWAVCLWFGLTGPMMGHHEDLAYRIAFHFGFIALVLAAVFGVIGRRHRSGKIGMYGALTVLGLAVLLMAIAFLLLAMG